MALATHPTTLKRAALKRPSSRPKAYLLVFS